MATPAGWFCDGIPGGEAARLHKKKRKQKKDAAEGGEVIRGHASVATPLSQCEEATRRARPAVAP